MHVNAKKIALGGLMLALTEVCITLGSIMETNTLFLLAAASFFVGIVIREAGLPSGGAFLLAGVLLGLLVSPNKLYVLSYAAMGCYILAAEAVWKFLGKVPGSSGEGAEASFEKTVRRRRIWFWAAKYLVFNLMYLPMLLVFQKLLFGRELPALMLVGAVIAGQIGIFLYDRAYEYVQVHLWGKLRGRFL